MRQPPYYERPKSDREYKQAKRKCLSCGRGFESEWEGNRVCGACKKTDAHQSPTLGAYNNGWGVASKPHNP